MANRKKTPSSDLLSQWLAQNPDAHLLDNPRTTTTGGTRDGGYSDIHTPSADTSGTPTTDLSQLSNSANYGKLIALLAQALGTDESTLLGMLGINMQDMSGAQQADWNKQLLDQLMSLSLEYDKRGYNEKMLADQRLYDNPQNQLARLMGAGISRDAAIQMLSGGSGSGGSGVVTGDAAALAPGISASQSDLNGMQTALMPVQTAFGAISAIANAVSGLGSFGISAATLATSLAATRALTAGTVLSNTQLAKTLAGVESASTVIGAISQAVDVGLIKRNHSFDSAQHMIDFIRENASTFEPFQNLVSSGTLDSINKDVYSLNALNAGYKSWRESRDFNIDRKHIVKMQGLEEIFKTLDIGRVNSDIALNGAKYNEIIVGVTNSTNLANSQLALNEANRLKVYAEASNVDAQTDLLHQEYEMNQYELSWLDANIDDINSVRTTQLQLEVAQWEKMTPTELQSQAESWLKDKQNQRTIIAIESMFYGDRKSAMDARHDPNAPAGSDQSFADWIVYMHNLFSTALPNSPHNSRADDVLGGLAGSKVARYLLKASKYAL